jgi:hypothetical protein
MPTSERRRKRDLPLQPRHDTVCPSKQGIGMWNILWFMRMVRWARRPPSAKHVKFVFTIIAAGLLIAGIEKYIGWPDILDINRTPKKVILEPLSGQN